MSRHSLTRVLAFTLLTALSLARPAAAEEPFILLQSTTSPENSGLYKHILPLFKAKTGIDVRVVAVGTGQALKNAENGDGDAVLVHDKAAEEKFVADSFGVKRIEVMYNDFVIVGPMDDPAGIKGGKLATAALKTLAEKKAIFASRGDDSGTHKIEMRLWQSAGIDPKTAGADPNANPNATGPGWYRSTGSGMGATLNTASGLNAYTLTDRGTWAAFNNRGQLEILVEGDPALFNLYSVIQVSPARHPHVKAKDAETFISWLTGPEGQAAIAGFRVGGEPAFFPRHATGQ